MRSTVLVQRWFSSSTGKSPVIRPTLQVWEQALYHIFTAYEQCSCCGEQFAVNFKAMMISFKLLIQFERFLYFRESTRNSLYEFIINSTPPDLSRSNMLGFFEVRPVYFYRAEVKMNSIQLIQYFDSRAVKIVESGFLLFMLQGWINFQ